MRQRLTAVLIPAALTAGAALAVACGSSTAAPAASPSPSPMADATPPSLVNRASLAGENATIVRRGSEDRRDVALTFDAPREGAGNIAEILQTLERENIRATFTVTGLWSEQNRDLLLSIAAQGHQIINGGYHGASFTGTSTDSAPMKPLDRALELSRTEVTVYRLTQRSTRPYFRPPYGDFDKAVLHEAATGGYNTVVLWTIDAGSLAATTPESIAAYVRAAVTPGSIVRMSTASTSPDAAALPLIITALRDQGYGFATIEEAIAP